MPALGLPVGSPRNAADSTDMPSSSPIKWKGLYIAAYQPLASVFKPYSLKQVRA